MARNLFSIPIFFIVFRETLEAAIIVSVLLGLVEQIVSKDSTTAPILPSTPIEGSPPTPSDEKIDPAKENNSTSTPSVNEDDTVRVRRLIKKLRWQIFLGAISGFVIALAVGAAFIAVWFTQAADLWSKSEDLWEGIFSLIAYD
ncbi:hypothetical protein Clacol_005049 [Clathrus columnatus]|uniref:Uncharacterized protein n=1 Tax=Clathrus columnatus TaxID=1419009 RepID=A0AAV5AE95_9AGAM|nr:hypothetical protein Clacol_005049 [Clathrus columnatus]